MNKIIYLDAAATYQKNARVIDAEMNFLTHGYANSGRGVCARAAAVDNMILLARKSVSDFIGANPNQIVFTSGATDGLNRAVNIILGTIKNKKPVVAVSDLDHHSARMPWMAADMRGCADIIVMPLDAQKNIDIENIPYADVMVITAMSNVLGVAQNVYEIIRAARQKNPDVITVVDAAQYVVHLPINAHEWDADFIAFSGHKIGADTGLGILYIKNPDSWAPDKFGGGMVNKITGADSWIYNLAPDKFEAGTLPLTQIAGLKTAIDELVKNRPNLELIKKLYDALSDMPRVHILTERNAAVLSFVIDGMHVLDFGMLMGAHNVCVRVGNMCATWINNALGVDGCARISVGDWNTDTDIEKTIEIIRGIIK